MRKIGYILLIAAAMIVGACEGPAGPMGPPGEDGEENFAKVFDFNGDFNAGNEYSIVETYPSNIEVYDDDVVLVYLLWTNEDGVDIWRLMPQTVFIRENDVNGEIVYNFDYTSGDVRVFLEFTIDEADLLPSETQNQWFKVAVVPSLYAKSHDVTNFSSLMNDTGLQIKTFDPVDVNTTPIQK